MSNTFNVCGLICCDVIGELFSEIGNYYFLKQKKKISVVLYKYFKMLKRKFSSKKSRRKKVRKMAIMKKDLPRGRGANANFKSKLALVLGSREFGSNGHSYNNKNGDVKKGDYQKLQHLLGIQKLPLTVIIKRFNGVSLNREDGSCTVQGYQKMTKLQCVGPQSDEISVPASESKVSVKFLSIDNTAMYSTIGELRGKRREYNITWFTSTRTFTVNETLYTVGQIFSFAPSNLLASFKRDRNIRGVNVCLYPTNKKLFFPIDTEGSFKKCDSPTTYQTCELSELAKTDNFPYFIFFHGDEIPSGLKKYADRHLFVKDKSDVNIVFVSRQIRGSLQIHSFPVYNDLYAKISAKPTHVDILDENELKMVKQSIEADLENGKGEMYQVKTYNELRIIRLLEEIFVELKNSTYLQPQTMIISGNQEMIKLNDKIYSKLIEANNSNKKTDSSKSYENRVIKTFLKNATTTGRISEARYLKSGDGDGNKTSMHYNYATQQRYSFYVNKQTSSDRSTGNESDDECKTRRELVVEFDDGGYVIIPFSGKSPKISVDQVEEYLSQDNIAYNYKEKQRQQQRQQQHNNNNSITPTDDEHVYQYISSDELEQNTRINSLASQIKEKVTIRPQVLQKKQDQNYKDSILDRYSTTYDYPHLGHFSIPSSLSRRYVKDHCVEEVVDLLKWNMLNHHIEVFRQNSIDGEKLTLMHEEHFLDLNFTKFEARKLNCFIDGWRPRNDADTQSWLSKLAKEWNVEDVSNYLLHVNMQSLQNFALRHKVDGYLLIQMVADDLLESLITQHNLVLRHSDIQRLRNYILEDDKPKFKFFM